jgi:hypothetical protein
MKIVTATTRTTESPARRTVRAILTGKKLADFTGIS